MCSLYSITTSFVEMRRLSDVLSSSDEFGSFLAARGGSPKNQAPVVRRGDRGERRLISLEWGFDTPKISEKTGKSISPNAWKNARDVKQLLKS